MCEVGAALKPALACNSSAQLPIQQVSTGPSMGPSDPPLKIGPEFGAAASIREFQPPKEARPTERSAALPKAVGV